MGPKKRADVLQLASKEAVLGLLIREPDHSYHLDQRLQRDLGSAEYPRGTARQAIDLLERDGLIRLSAGAGAISADQPRRPRKTYEATRAGIEYFKDWLAAETLTPPVREELHPKITLCEPEDLPLLIQAVKRAEHQCITKLHETNKRAISERHAVGEREWKQQRLRIVVTSSDAAWWNSRIRWLTEVRLYLVSEWETYQHIEQRSQSD